MLKITIELLPFGSQTNKKTLGVMHIWNVLTGTKTIGNYGYKIFKGETDNIWKSGAIKKFPRKRLNAWDLLFRALYDSVGERNNSPKLDNTHE